MPKNIRVELELYNIDYDFLIEEKKLKEGILEIFVNDYELSCCNPETIRLVNNYIGWDKLEEDYLDIYIDSIKDEIVEEFEEKLTYQMIEVLQEHNNLTINEILDYLPYDTLIIPNDYDMLQMIEDKLIFLNIEYSIDWDSTYEITLK